jgi:DNA-binding transcriptional regulator GbsR (MarR family)
VEPNVTDDQAAYVEQVAQMIYGGGLPRMAGRIWGWLLICEPPQQTAAQLAEELQASRGSISGMARLLEGAGLIHRVTRPGDRREHFGIPPGSVIAVLEGGLAKAVAWRRLAENGLVAMAGRPAEARGRLEELRDIYTFMEQELPALTARFRRQRADHESTAAATVATPGTADAREDRPERNP